MSTLKDADLGTELSRKEFEDAAEEAGLVEDLLDRDDLPPGHFLSIALQRVNASLHPGGHVWVSHGDRVVLIRSELREPLLSLGFTRDVLKGQISAIERTIEGIVRGASK